MLAYQIALILVIMALVALLVSVSFRIFANGNRHHLQFSFSCALLTGLVLFLFDLSLTGMIALFS